MSAGQTDICTDKRGQKWGCPPSFFMFIGFFVFPTWMLHLVWGVRDLRKGVRKCEMLEVQWNIASQQGYADPYWTACDTREKLIRMQFRCAFEVQKDEWWIWVPRQELYRKIAETPTKQGIWCSNWRPLATWKSEHIWRSWPEITQKFIKSFICQAGNSAKIFQISRLMSKFSPKFAPQKKEAKTPTKFTKIRQILFTKGLQLWTEPYADLITKIGLKLGETTCNSYAREKRT